MLEVSDRRHDDFLANRLENGFGLQLASVFDKVRHSILPNNTID